MDRKIEKKKWPPKKIAWLAGGILLFSFILYNFIWGDTSSIYRANAERLTISAVTKGPFQESVPVTGAVMPIKTFFLDATEGGKVEEIFREAGSILKEGEKILRLGNTDLLISISQQEASVAEQRDRFANTRFNFQQNRIALKRQLLTQNYEAIRLKRLYERQKSLYENNLIAKQEFEQAEDEYKYQKQLLDLNIEQFKRDSTFQEIQLSQLQKSFDRLQQNLKRSQQRLDELVLKAPISGQLTSLDAEIGQSKSRGQRLGQIDDLNGFKIRAQIDEFYLPKIGLQQEGEFEFAGASHRIRIFKIFPEISEGRFEVDLEFVGEEPTGIRRGQTVHIRLELSGLSEQILLPLGGFFQKTGGQWAYVLDQSGDFATKRNIRLGRKNQQVYEVLEGLQPGEKVVTSSYDDFGDNDKLVFKNKQDD